MLKRYLRSICKALPCTGKMKRSIVSQLRESIEYYLFQNPDADLEVIQAHFGTPQEIAVSCIEEQGTSVLLKKNGFTQKVLAIIAGTMAVVTLIWISYIGWATRDTQKIADGRVGISVMED